MLRCSRLSVGLRPFSSNYPPTRLSALVSTPQPSHRSICQLTLLQHLLALSITAWALPVLLVGEHSIVMPPLHQTPFSPWQFPRLDVMSILLSSGTNFAIELLLSSKVPPPSSIHSILQLTPPTPAFMTEISLSGCCCDSHGQFVSVHELQRLARRRGGHSRAAVSESHHRRLLQVPPSSLPPSSTHMQRHFFLTPASQTT